MSTDARQTLQALQAEIREKGFLTTWQTNLVRIANEHNTTDLDYWGKSLFALLTADSSIARELEASGVTEPPADDEGSTASNEADHAAFVAATRAVLASASGTIPEIVEADGTPVRVVTNAEFRNWGRTVKNVPALTAVPTTKAGVCSVVKWAAAQGKRVRVAGYRHTWGDLYASDGDVLISLLPLNVVDDLPAAEPGIDPKNQLQGIEVVGTVVEDGTTKALCRIGAATTNEQFRRWCLSQKGGALQWTVPLNVIMVEITWGGSNAPICHGAGLANRTLSDLVTAVEFVNPRGELQTVSDPVALKGAAGAFGLLGVVTAITLKLDPMTYAKLEPEKRRVALTIPPPEGFAVPKDVDMSGITPADLEVARKDFVRRAEVSYYAEWFWFTMQKDCWINAWHNDGNKAESRDYPGDLESEFQAAEEYLAGLIASSWLYNELPEWLQAKILGDGAMGLMPSSETIVTPLIDGLHFRRGIQNMRVWDMEWEIPIPPRGDDPSKPDWSICQLAWWHAISEVYAWSNTKDKVPMRLTLEMRIMGGSDVTMAPQHGNDFGTCSIEVLTTTNTDRSDWAAFMQAVTDLWTGLTDASGNPLNVRPHWAKEWQGLAVQGKPIAGYLRDKAYADRLPEFGAALKGIAEAGGYGMKDLEARFANPSLSDVFGGIYTQA